MVIPYARRAFTAELTEVRVTACDVAALLGDVTLLPELDCAVRDGDLVVRIAALEALHEFGDLAAPCIPVARERLDAAENADEAAAAASLLDNLACTPDRAV